MKVTRAITLNRAGSAGKSLLVGGVFGIDAIGHCVALASLAFAGPLAFAMGYGTMLILLSSAIIALVLAWRSVFPGAAGLAGDTSIAILAPAMVLAAGSVTGTPEEQLATAVAIMGGSTLLSGLAIYLVGRLHLGQLVRIMPFPVAAGFLVASGWLLVSAAFGMLTETSTVSETAQSLIAGNVPPNLLLGVLMTVAFFVAARLVGGAFSIALPLISALILFYLGLSLAGMTVADARAGGYLPDLGGASLAAAYPDLSLLGHVDWTVVGSTSVTIAVVVVLNTVGFMLNVGGVEMATRSDVSIDTEARTTGAANLAIGAFGGLVGFVASDTTVIAHKLGCGARSLGLALGAVTLLGFFFAEGIVSHMPEFISAGLLLYFGCVMLQDWLILSWARLKPLDWAVIPIILAVTIAFDILVAVVAGLFAALVIFVYTYSTQSVIRFQVTGTARRSPVDRNPEDEAVLAQLGGRIHITGLQGYLFFGSIERVTEMVRQRMSGADPIEALVIDFHHVTGLDSAACAALLKLGLLSETGQFRISFSSVAEQDVDTMRKWGIGESGRPCIRFYPSLAAALEDAEDDVLVLHGAGATSEVPLLRRLVDNQISRAADLLGWMERIEASTGQVLIREGASDGDIYFIESGRVNVQMNAPGVTPTRLRSLCSGSVVGEAAHYLGRRRTADVVVHSPSVIWRLSEEAIDRMEAEDRDLAAQLHALMARSLAEKVEKTNGLLSAALA